MNDLHLYDKIVASTLINIYSLTKDSKNIVIKDFKNNNKYLYILDICNKVNFIYYNNDKKIKIDTNFLSFFEIYLKERKKGIRFARKSQTVGAIDVEEICHFMADAFNVDEDIFGRIYEEYYAKDKKGKQR